MCVGGGWQSKRQSGDIRLATCGHLSDVIHAYAFMNLIPGGTHTYTDPESPTCMDTHIHTDTKTKLSAMCIKSWSIAKLAFGQYLRTNWQMSKGFDGRVLEEKKH